MQVTQLKERICQAIDARRDDIVALGEDILRHPELGFKEHRTAGLVADLFHALGIPTATGVAVTGVIGRLVGRGHGVRYHDIGNTCYQDMGNTFPYTPPQKERRRPCPGRSVPSWRRGSGLWFLLDQVRLT